MEGIRERALPPPIRVAREQISFVLASAGRSWPVLALFALLFAWAATSARGGFPAHSSAVFLALMAASILTGASWPKQPGHSHGAAYFRSLPGGRPGNIALRTVSAWAVLMLFATFLSALSHRFGAPVAQPAWSYLAPLLGATVVLFAISGPMATLKHSAVWISGIVWVPLILSRLGGTAVGEALLSLLDGRWGVVTLVSGQLMVSGRLLGPESDITPAQFVFDLPAWLGASAIWLTASLVIFAVMISRPVEA